MGAPLTLEQRKERDQRREAHNAALRKVGASKQTKYGTGTFGGRYKRLAGDKKRGRIGSAHAYLKARPREEPSVDRPLWGSYGELGALKRFLAVGSGGKKAVRAIICAEHGVPNTGRQWRQIKKAERHIRHELKARKARNTQRRTARAA